MRNNDGPCGSAGDGSRIKDCCLGECEGVREVDR